MPAAAPARSPRSSCGSGRPGPRTRGPRHTPRGRRRARCSVAAPPAAARAPGRARARPARRPSARPCRSRRPYAPRRTAAARAAARRRPPRSRRPRRPAGRARPRRPAATRPPARRPRSPARRSGDQVWAAAPDELERIEHEHRPERAPARVVPTSRSVLIDDATAGPSHSSSAGTASPADFPDWGGPKATSAWRCSARAAVRGGDRAPAPGCHARPRAGDRQAAARAARPARAARRGGTDRRVHPARRAADTPRSARRRAARARRRSRAARAAAPRAGDGHAPRRVAELRGSRASTPEQLRGPDPAASRARTAPRRGRPTANQRRTTASTPVAASDAHRRSPPCGASAARLIAAAASTRHPGVGVGQRRLEPRAVVLDHERAPADPPQRLTGRQHRDQPASVCESPSSVTGELDLALVLVVDDPRRGIRDQPLGDPRRARPASPAACRSASLCSTTRFITPNWRASLKFD